MCDRHRSFSFFYNFNSTFILYFQTGKLGSNIKCYLNFKIQSKVEKRR